MDLGGLQVVILSIILLAIGAYLFDSFRSKTQEDKKEASSKSKAKSKTKTTAEPTEPTPVVRQRTRPKKVLTAAEKAQISKDKAARREQEEREHQVRLLW
jgi:FtsZ-interacting cell division protein ZipA